MFTSSDDNCASCAPGHLSGSYRPKAVLSTLPFLATFALTTLIAYRRVYPLLSNVSLRSDKPRTDHFEPSTQNLGRRIAAVTFSSTIALSTVLTELLLCEISNSFNPSVRSGRSPNHRRQPVGTAGCRYPTPRHPHRDCEVWIQYD